MSLHRMILHSVKGIVAVQQEIVKEIAGVMSITLEKATQLLELKAYGGTEQNGTPTPTTPKDIVCNNGALRVKDKDLPSGYRRLSGITTTTGNNYARYITDFYLQGNDTLKFSFTYTGTSTGCNVLGCYESSSSQANYSYYATTNTANYARYNGGTYNSTVVRNTKYNITMSPTGMTGGVNNSSWTAQTFTSTAKFCIFATSETGDAAGNTTTRNLEISGNIEIVGRALFIPCERLSDGVIGYYETYTDTFYGPTLSGGNTNTLTSLGYDNSQWEVYADGTRETISSGRGSVTCENLLSVGNYTDEQEILSGLVTRKIGIKVLNGMEVWTEASTSSSIRYYLIINDSIGGANRSEVVCSHYNYISTGQTVGGTFLSSKRLFLVPGQTINTVTQFKQRLADQYNAGTPVIVVYPLATESVESVAGQSLAVSGNTTLSITASLDDLELYARYKALP